MAFGLAALFSLVMGIIQWSFYVLGIICMIKYLKKDR